MAYLKFAGKRGIPHLGNVYVMLYSTPMFILSIPRMIHFVNYITAAPKSGNWKAVTKIVEPIECKKIRDGISNAC